MHTSIRQFPAGSSRAIVLGVVMVAIISVGAYGLLRRDDSASLNDRVVPAMNDAAGGNVSANDAADAAMAPIATAEQETVATDDSVDPADVKTFTLTSQGFSFSPKEIRVKQGDVVKVVFNNAGGLHDWVLDEFDVKTPRIGAGESAEVQFVAGNVGTFEYYCSVGNHRAMGMKGSFIVEP